MTTEPVPTWKTVVAAILDFLTIFFVAGYVIAQFTGETTQDGFQLSGASALLLFAIIAAYFVVGRKYAGGTLWQRILGAR